jgi:hypothetical protein
MCSSLLRYLSSFYEEHELMANVPWFYKVINLIYKLKGWHSSLGNHNEFFIMNFKRSFMGLYT